MNRRRIAPRTALIPATLLVCAMSLACGGGGGAATVPTPGGLVATFTASNASPGPGTISMASGVQAGASFEVRVLVTGITDFFGAAFRINFSPATAVFNNFTASGSFITTGGTVDIAADPGAAGELLVRATLQDQVPGVTPAGSDLLITLRFTATAETGGSANSFTFSAASTRDVQTCAPGNPLPACSPVPDASLTWSGGVMTATR